MESLIVRRVSFLERADWTGPAAASAGRLGRSGGFAKVGFIYLRINFNFVRYDFLTLAGARRVGINFKSEL